MPRHLHRVGSDAAPPAIPRDRGRFMSIDMINATYYRGAKTPRWIRRNFAPPYKITQGRDVYWWERDCEAWLDCQRQIGNGA